MTEGDAGAIAELFSSLVGAILADMRQSGLPRERMQKFVQLISDTNEATASDATLQDAVLHHLAIVAQIVPPKTG